MPTEHYQRVKTFMEKVGQETPTEVVVPDEHTRLLRARLILEEALETVHALGISVRVQGQEANIDSCEFTPNKPVDLEGVADGCADISVVTIGTLIAFGIEDEELLREVDEANLRKFTFPSSAVA
ncbi:MAG: nucleoside triphosphate pyrophosphohydrolase family protein [Bacteroidetes bacterium]|nr:nucleoside triphosphate pyrophosphohydrolase family protein [Bacteroidota bacterium]